MTAGTGDGDLAVRVLFENVRSTALEFRLEPWGEQYPMRHGAVFELLVHGPQKDAALQVEHGDDHITVYGWPGSTIRVFDAGTELGAGSGERTRVPAVPPGSTVARFVKTVFGRLPTRGSSGTQ